MVLKTDTVTRPPKQDVLTSLRTAIATETVALRKLIGMTISNNE